MSEEWKKKRDDFANGNYLTRYRISSFKDGCDWTIANPPDNLIHIEQVMPLVDALISISEYWNGDQNEQAIGDMASYATNLARETLRTFTQSRARDEGKL